MGITRAQQVAASGEPVARTDRALPPEPQRKSTSDMRAMCMTLLDELDEHKRSAVDGGFDGDADALAGVWNTNQCGDADVDRLAPSHAISRIAVLNRELKALEVRYFRTRLQLEKSMEKNNQLRQDMTKLRGHSTKLERETCKLRNLIDRIQGEKKQLELQAIHNRDYAKKIEQRFFMGSKGQSVLQCNVELGGRVKTLEKRVQTKDAALESQRLELQDAHEKLRILKRALETRFEDMQLNGSLHTGILFELTRLQDQCTSLALQLSDERKSARALQSRLDSAQARETELDDALVVREAMLAGLERERVVLDDKLAAARNEKQTFAFEKATLLKFIQEQAEVKLQLDAQIRQLHEAKASELAVLHGKLQAVMEERAALQDSLRDSSVACEQLHHECQRLSGALDDEQRAKREVDAREQALAVQLQHVRDAASKSEDDFRAARDVCRELQTAVAAYEHETQELRARIAALEVAEADVRQQLATKQSEELALRAAMENALRDLEMLSKQRNDAAKAMNEAVTISASSLDEQQALEATIAAQRKQLEQLKSSKSLLQNAMLEQLSALRKQLQLERVQRIEAESKVKQLVAFSSPRRKHQCEQPARIQQLQDGVVVAPQQEQQEQQQPHECKRPSSRMATSSTVAAASSHIRDATTPFDADAPQPLPPPLMAGAPSPLPSLLGNLGGFHGDTHSECSSSSSSDSEDEAERVVSSSKDDNARVQPLGVAMARSHSPLSHSPEHRTEYAAAPLETQISLLELAEGDL